MRTILQFIDLSVSAWKHDERNSEYIHWKYHKTFFLVSTGRTL